MRWRVIGQGDDEAAWRDRLRATPEAILIADRDPIGLDGVELALLEGEPQAVVLGGPLNLRAELVRRAAELSLPILTLYPPGPDPDALYQVAVLPHDQTPPLVPAMPLSLHPSLVEIRRRLDAGQLGSPVSVRYEAELGPGPEELAAHAGAAAVAAQSILGELQAVTTTISETNPPRLVAHLRGSAGRDAEIRLTRRAAGTPSARFELLAERATLIWEHEPSLQSASVLREKRGEDADRRQPFPAWDARDALLAQLHRQIAGEDVSPNLRDGIQAMEIADAIDRSARKGRTVELHRDEISELGSFKAVMASLGCGVILMSLTLYVLSLVARALDLPGAGLIAWSIVPLLGGYAILQFLRLAARPSQGRGTSRRP